MLNFLSFETAPDSLSVCSVEGETAGRGALVSSRRGWGGGTDYTVHTSIEHLEQFSPLTPKKEIMLRLS